MSILYAILVCYIRRSIQRINETQPTTHFRSRQWPSLSPYLGTANNASEIKTLFARYTYIAWHSVYDNDAFGIVYACAKERRAVMTTFGSR